MKKTILLFIFSLVFLLCLVTVWEFVLEDIILSRFSNFYEKESFDGRLEYILTSFAVGFIVLLIPFYMLYHAEKERAAEKLFREEMDLVLADQPVEDLRKQVPLCSYCNMVKNEKGVWELFDMYVLRHSAVKLTHHICPLCKIKVSSTSDG